MRLTAAVTQEGAGYVAQCLEVDVASQGDTLELALANLKEAIELYFEDGNPQVSSPPIIAPIDVSVP